MRVTFLNKMLAPTPSRQNTSQASSELLLFETRVYSFNLKSLLLIITESLDLVFGVVSSFFVKLFTKEPLFANFVLVLSFL